MADVARAGRAAEPSNSVMVRDTYRRVRVLLGLFMAGLVASGLTAFPLIPEVNLLHALMGPGTAIGSLWPDMARWIAFVHRGLNATAGQYPFMLYGTDWLAFAHLVIALAFIGPWRDPVRNVWVVEFGLLACGLIIPLAVICGPLRGIPWFWIAFDCSFGVLGAVPLVIAHGLIREISPRESARSSS